MIYNGLMLGAMMATYAEHGLGVPFGGWLLVHGVTELFAITLAGAAGFRIGWALAFPGENSRLDALREAGQRRHAGDDRCGFDVAGRRTCWKALRVSLMGSTSLRYAIAAASGVFWLAYFYAPMRRR